MLDYQSTTPNCGDSHTGGSSHWRYGRSPQVAIGAINRNHRHCANLDVETNLHISEIRSRCPNLSSISNLCDSRGEKEHTFFILPGFTGEVSTPTTIGYRGTGPPPCADIVSLFLCISLYMYASIQYYIAEQIGTFHI